MLNALSGVPPGSDQGPPCLIWEARQSTAMPVSNFYHPRQRDTFTGNLTGLVLDDVGLRERHLHGAGAGKRHNKHGVLERRGSR